MSVYDDILAERKGTKLRSSLYTAADANPEEEAFFSSLSEKTGLPVEALRNDRGAEGKRLQTVHQADTLLTQAPKTAEWMANQDNARHSHDDADNLAQTEALFVRRKGEQSTLGMASTGDQALAKGAKQAAGFAFPTAVQSVKTAPLRFAQGVNEALAGVGELTGYYALLRGTGIDKDPAAFLRDNMQVYQAKIQGVEEIRPQTRAQANVKMATDSIATSLMTAPAAIAGRIPQLAAFAVSAPGQLFDYIDAGYHPVQAASFSAMNKVMEGATEMIGVGKLFQPGSFAKKASGFLVGDLFGEEVNNAYAQLQAKGTLQPDLTLEEFTKSAVDTAVVTIMAGGIQGAATAPLAAMSSEYQRAAKAQQNMDFMLALGDSAKSAKLLQRMPAKYKEFIQAIKSQGDVENVFIDADKFQTFFQSQGVDPQQMAESIGAAEEYAQALAVGGEMVIPLEDYAMHLAGTDYHAELSKDLRLHPDVMSYHEAEKFKGGIPGQLDSLLKDVTDGEGETASKKVYDDIYQGLTAVGRDDATERFEALIQTSRVNTLAEQQGRDAWEIWQENPIKFKRETFMTRKDFIDTTVDPLLDRLRGKGAPKEGKVFGTSALTLLRTKGLQEHGDLVKMDVDKDRKPFTRKLIRPDGLTLDAAGELLWEAGYFKERPTEREVLDAIDREMRGDPLYSDSQTDQQALQMSADLEEMQMFLDQNGIDLATMSNLEIRDALAKVTSFDQSAPDIEKRIAILQGLDKIGTALRGEETYEHPTEIELSQVDAGTPRTSGARDTGSRTPQVFASLSTGNVALDYGQAASDLITRSKTEGGRPSDYLVQFTAFLNSTAKRSPQALQDILDIAQDLRASGYTITDKIGMEWSGQFMKAIASEYRKLPAEVDAEIKTLFQNDKRASITFLPTHRQIELFKGADASSVIHEFSHSWLEELKRDGQAGVNEQVKADWEIAAKHIGIDPASVSIPVEAHEKFADTGIAYVAEGKAPSVELIPVFQRFKAQLALLYKRAKIALLPMNDEIRGVFDRLLASKEQTAEARRQQGFVPLILTAESAGMTERGFAAYRKAMEKAHLAAEDALQQKLMREMAREDLVWWKEAEAKMKEEVTKEAQQEPIYDAFQALSTGKTFAGDDAPDGFKLSRIQLEKTYGKEWVKKLPRWFKKGIGEGMHPDEVAEVFGFSSGDDMIQQMINALPFRQFVDAETARRMLRDHGDMMTDGRLPEEAMQAVHSDMQAEVLHAELKAIKTAERQSRPAVKAALQDAKADARAAREEAAASLPPIDAFRTWAAQAIGNMPVGKLRPSSYLRAERKAANAAQELYQKQKFAEAAEEKQRQIANMFLYREAMAAQEDAAKAYKFANKLQTSAAQERIGKAGEDYLEQINGILETYEFKKITVGERNKRLTLREWAAQQEEMGLESSIDPRILDGALRKNYQELTVDELRAVHDALKNINHLAIESNKIRIGAEELELQDALDQLTDAAEIAYSRKKVPSKGTRTPLQSLSAKLKSFDASLIKVEQVVEWLDGWKQGPWTKLIFQPLASAQAAENDLSVTFTAKLNAIFNDYFTANDYSVIDKLSAKGQALKDGQGLDDTLDKVLRAGNRMQEKVHIASLNMPMTREEIISVGLNVGNASNLDKLMRGKGWRPDQLEEILSHITASDAQFIQETWDMINELWPAMAALQKRMSGVAPPKIEASPVTLGGVDLAGGYFPVIYDQTESAAGQKQADANAEKMFGDNYVRATTKHGSTNERTGAAYPILLSLTIIPSHMAGVIHDITHREAITTINRLLSNQQVMDTMRETIGLEYHRLMTLWLANVANDRNVDREGTEQFKNFLNALRVNTSIVGMGFRFSTMITQLAGYSQSLEMVKGRYLAQGLKEFTTDHEAAVAWVMEKSGEIRHRRNNLDRDLRDGVRKLMGQSGVVPWIQAQAFAGIGLMDSFVSIPTWIGAYRQAEAGGASEAESINAADKAVRLSQGSGGAKDLAAVQRSGTVMKYLTMFYSYYSMLYSRLRNMGRLKSQNEIGWFAVAYKSALMVALPAILTDLLVARGPDDDEDKLAWAARKVAMYPLGTIPILRDMVNAMTSGRGYAPSPMVRAADMVVTLPKQIEAVRDDRKAISDLLFDNADVVGYTFGLPTGQPKTTFRYIWDVMNDEANPEDAQDVLKGLLFTRKKGEQK